MAKHIGPNFWNEVQAAGISGNGWSWGADGTLNIGGLDQATQNAILAVYAAHNPATPSADPDERGFERDIYAAFDNDFLRINAVLAAFPVFAQLQSTLRDSNWPAASGIILATLGAGAITQTEYGSLKAAATTRHIPLTLI